MVRRTRIPAGALALLTVLLVAGTGFAAFTTTVSVQGSASAGTLGPFYWGATPTSNGFGTYSACSDSTSTTHSSDDTLNVVATNLAPGDLCGYSADLYNPGSLPAYVNETLSSTSGSLCAELDFSSNGFTPGVTIGAGGQTGSTNYLVPANGHIPWGGTIYLPSTADDSVMGGTCTFTVSVTGSAGL